MERESHRHAVLLVDDDADTREAMSFYLRSHGYEVDEASGGHAALRQLRTGCTPCVVIIDALMPGMNGWELLTMLRADPKLATIPTVMVSGRPEEAGLAVRLGVRAFITKPADLDTIAAVVDEHCPRRPASEA
jgi:CheY-like chemotaxis protein